MSTILIIVLILLLIGGLPQLGFNTTTFAGGYGVSGILGLILVVVLILALLRYV